VRGTLVFLRWSITEPFRAFYYLLTGRGPKTTGDDEAAEGDAMSVIARDGAEHGQPVAARVASVARIASPSVVPDGGRRRAAAENRAEPGPGFAFVDPALFPGR
jgi:hypothetical protein